MNPLKLLPLNSQTPIVDAQGLPTNQFMRFWLNAMRQIVASINGIQAALDAAAAANAAADAANTAATTATTAAATAQNAADAASADNAIANSGVTGLTLTATDAGASVTIAISAHMRIYADGTSVSVSSGSLTGKAYSTTYYLYYHDAGHTGGAVAYIASTNASDAIQTGDVHSVGAVLTPAALGSPKDGKANLAPGIVDL